MDYSFSLDCASGVLNVPSHHKIQFQLFSLSKDGAPSYDSKTSKKALLTYEELTQVLISFPLSEAVILIKLQCVTFL